MRKGNYIINGNQFFIVEKCNKNIVVVREIDYSLTRNDCDHAYDYKMLRKLGYLIEINEGGKFV